MDKFILGNNPMRDNSDTWITHLLDPKAIIRCTEGHVEIDAVYRHYQYRNSDGVIEEWTLSAYHLFTTDFLTPPEEQAGKLLDKAWRWYRSYMEFEDKNIDTDNEANNN
jgi:hypothetical protein